MSLTLVFRLADRRLFQYLTPLRIGRWYSQEDLEGILPYKYFGLDHVNPNMVPSKHDVRVELGLQDLDLIRLIR